ncbi:MAG: phosphate ABC transporter permease subunit PstC [Bacillota bacterium]
MNRQPLGTMGRPVVSRPAERVAELLLLLSAIASAAGIIFITAFVAGSGIPFLARTGIWAFITGSTWRPDHGVFGIFPMIAGSAAVTACALALGTPLGLATAVYLAEFAPRRLAAPVRQSVQLLAGIPSVVYGFYGLTVLVPLVSRVSSGPGFSVLAGGMVLAVMVLPTLVSLGEDAIASVPPEYREGSLALGATRWQTMMGVLVPTAKPGLVAAVVLAMGRAVGETMAVIMVTGNVARLPSSLLSPVYTLTGNIALEMGYAAGDHQQALFATGMVLFAFIMGLNFLARASSRGRKKR